MNTTTAALAQSAVFNYMVRAQTQNRSEGLAAMMLLAGTVGEALSKMGFADKSRDYVSQTLNRSFVEGKLTGPIENDSAPDIFTEVDALLERIKKS